MSAIPKSETEHICGLGRSRSEYAARPQEKELAKVGDTVDHADAVVGNEQ
jgi:hypothetical protein